MNFKDRVRSLLEAGGPHHRGGISKLSRSDKRIVLKKDTIKCQGCNKKFNADDVKPTTIKKDLPRINKKFLCPKCRDENK